MRTTEVMASQARVFGCTDCGEEYVVAVGVPDHRCPPTQLAPVNVRCHEALIRELVDAGVLVLEVEDSRRRFRFVTSWREELA